MKALRSGAYYAAHAALATIALALLPPLRQLPLRVPVTYERDGLFLTILAKSVSEDGLFHAARFGAPFGVDLVDWPLGMWLPLGELAGLTRLFGEPGTAINVYWLSSIVLAGLCATYALRRLRLAPGLAFVLGMLYAFQPYAFYRNVEHVNLAFPFVPLLALLCLRLAGARPEDETRGERALTLLACVAQGLSYVYYSFFACALLLVAAPLGWLRTRRARLPLRAAAAVAILAACSLLTVLPTLRYWHRHGYNPDLDYKPPAETDAYALKLRHLLMPIPEHPLAAMREVAASVERARFPGDNGENTLSRLGTLGSLALLGLLAFTVGRAAGALPARDDDLDAPAALTLATLLLATVGGLASLFSVFVSSDVRGWARIVVFLSFFVVTAAGVFLSRLAARLPLPGRVRPTVGFAALGLLLAGGLLDEIPIDRLWTIRSGSDAAFAEEREFVHRIESRLPQGAMVFQLPHMTVPVDRATYPPMLYYDPGRMVIHSRTLRWSWGALIGRQHDWGRAVAALPAAEQVRTLALAGFSGLWIDRWGYTGRERPAYPQVEATLATIVGEPFVTSDRGRYAFVSLVPYRQRLEAGLGGERLERARREVLADMPISHWTGGCDEERMVGGEWWRPCGSAATLELRNWRPGAIRVNLRARLRAGLAGTTVTVNGPGFDDHITLTPTGVTPYARTFEIDGTDTGPVKLTAPRSATVSLRADAPPAVGGDAAFELADLTIETRREIGGVPVNADGGVAVRTRY